MKYKSSRARAWRNAMVAAINAGLKQKIFSLDPDEPGAWPPRETREMWGHHETRVYTFSIEDIPAIASVSDIGYDELSIHVALWPTKNAHDAIRASNAGFWAGEMFASGWVERREGRWLQRGPSLFKCRRERIATVAALDVAPTGYADSGKFFL